VAEYRTFRLDVNSIDQLFAEGLVHVVQGSATKDVDDDVTPGRTYRYRVEARRADGTAASSPPVTVRIPVPPLSAARLDGNYNVTLTPQSQYGFTATLKVEHLGWVFRPNCKLGVCNVVWTDARGFTGVLTRSGATYTGSASGAFITKCGDTTSITTLTVVIHVVKGTTSFSPGAWLAERFKGTITQREAASGCVPSGATYAVSGAWTSS
jgi:hypothetical protein